MAIEVVEGTSHPLGDCLAVYDCAEDRIRITDPASWTGLLGEGEPYRELPPEVLLGALLTHEMAHALAARIFGDLAFVDQEYIAAAMELELMEPESRRILTEAAPVRTPGPGLVSAGIYALAPRKFATNAWLHFSLPGNGCGLIRAMLAGEASFAGTGR